MSGGLRHQSDEKKRPSYLVGYKLADKASHPVKGTQCSCAEASSVLELMKFITPNTLTGADVLRDVEKVTSINRMRFRESMLVLFHAALDFDFRRPADHDGATRPFRSAVLVLPPGRSGSREPSAAADREAHQL